MDDGILAPDPFTCVSWIKLSRLYCRPQIAYAVVLDIIVDSHSHNIALPGYSRASLAKKKCDYTRSHIFERHYIYI